MTTLLELKEKLIRFYSKNETYIIPVIKFVVALVLFASINANIGYMEKISTLPAALILALVCSVLPASTTVAFAALVVLADMYALSLEVCAVTLLLFVIIYFIYFRFAPKNRYNVVLAPLCFQFHIPYILPIGMGLLKEIYSIFSLFCGIVVYFFLDGVKQNASVLSGGMEEESAVSKIVVILNQLIGNREMYLVLAIMAATLVIVHTIRRTSMENAWIVAIISGILFQVTGLISGYLILGISGKIAEVLIGSAVAAVIAFIIQFFCFHLDYSRTERLQFEDDEYYYYVKAIPKVMVSGPEKKVKRFSGREEEVRLSKKRFAEEMDIDEELLD